MHGRELSTLVVILSVIMGIYFKVIKLEHRVLYSHYSFSIDGKSLFLSYFCIQRSTQDIESQESYKKSRFPTKSFILHFRRLIKGLKICQHIIFKKYV